MLTVRPEILLLIIGCMVVTIIPRVLPLMLINSLRPPPVVLQWLQYAVPAIIAALLVQDLISGGGEQITYGLNSRFLAGIVALVVAFITRSIIATVLLGIASYSLLNLLFGLGGI